MIVKYSQIIHSPVVELKNQSRLGVTSDLVIQKSDLTIKGAIVRTGLFGLIKKAAAESDIVELNRSAVILNSNDSLVNISEVERIKEALNEKLYGINQSVKTKSGKLIGQVYDYTIDNATCAIQKFYVKSFLSERIIPVSAVTEIKGKRITIRDDFKILPAAEPARALKPETV